MTEHRDESLMDKIKGAFGMGTDADDGHTDRTDRTDHPDAMHAHTAGAGIVGDPEDLGGTANRPAGPDYGAREEVIPGEFGAGLDSEEMAGTGDNNTGTGLAYDYERGSVTEPTDATVGDAEWTRGGAASGESPFGTDDDEVDTERRELGI